MGWPFPVCVGPQLNTYPKPTHPAFGALEEFCLTKDGI